MQGFLQLYSPIDSKTIFPTGFFPVEISSAVCECKHLIDFVAPPTPPVGTCWFDWSRESSLSC